MEINSVNPLYSGVNSDVRSSHSTEHAEKSKQTKDFQYDDLFEQNFGFIGADEKFLDSFSRLTSRMHIMATSFLKNKIDTALVIYNREKITQEIKQKMGIEELTEELKQKIYTQAKELAESDGLEGVNMSEFLNYILQKSNIPQEIDKKFFNTLEQMYNTERVEEVA